MSEMRDIVIAYTGVLFQGNSGHRTRCPQEVSSNLSCYMIKRMQCIVTATHGKLRQELITSKKISGIDS